MLKTTDGRLLSVSVLSANDTYKILSPLLPTFADIFDSYAQAKNLKFYKASYQYGDRIIYNKKAYLPLANGDTIEFNDPLLPKELAYDLNCDASEPLAIFINKRSELYLPTGNAIVSHAMLHPGDWIGIASAVNPIAAPISSAMQWNLNAGVRYIFTLSKATSKARYAKLQRYHGAGIDCPETSEGQWADFVQISNHADSPWRCELIFFPREFINLLKTYEGAMLSRQLLEIRRLSYNVWHNVSLIWDTCFNAVEQERRLWHYSAYALSTTRQLFLIAANSANGFAPATSDDYAPIKLLQDIYTNTYGIAEDEHNNVFMHSVDFKGKDPIYYSLHYPTLARHNPETFKGKTFITLLDDVEKITSTYQKYLNKVMPSNELLDETAKNNKFSFYHPLIEKDSHTNILNSEQLLATDARFANNILGKHTPHSHFFKGVIKIEHLNQI